MATDDVYVIWICMYYDDPDDDYDDPDYAHVSWWLWRSGLYIRDVLVHIRLVQHCICRRQCDHLIHSKNLGFSYRLHHSQSWMTVCFSKARRLLHKQSLMILLYWKASRLHHKQASLMLCQLTVSEAQHSQFRILWPPTGRLLVCFLHIYWFFICFNYFCRN